MAIHFRETDGIPHKVSELHFKKSWGRHLHDGLHLAFTGRDAGLSSSRATTSSSLAGVVFMAAIQRNRSDSSVFAGPDTIDFVFLKRLDGRLGDAGHRDGMAKGVKNLDRVSILAAGHRVVVNHLHHIACTEIVLGNVASQNGIGVELESHLRVLSGTNVMNFVVPDKCSFIQMEQMRSVRPFGPVSETRIS